MFNEQQMCSSCWTTKQYDKLQNERKRDRGRECGERADIICYSTSFHMYLQLALGEKHITIRGIPNQSDSTAQGQNLT